MTAFQFGVAIGFLIGVVATGVALAVYASRPTGLELPRPPRRRR